MFLKMRKCTWCKVLAFSLSFLVLAVPFCAVSVNAESDNIEGYPTVPFSCYYYDLESGEMVTTPEFKALPSSLAVSNGSVQMKDYIIVKGRDINGNVAYYAHLFSEGNEPTGVDIDYSYSGMSSKMENLKSTVTETAALNQLLPRLGQTWVEWLGVGGVIPDACGVYFWHRLVTAYSADRDAIYADYSENWWKNAILSNPSEIASVYAKYCGDGAHPWLDITLHYTGKIQSYIAMYVASTGTWQWINSYAPTQAYSYTIVGAESIVSTSFEFSGSTALSGLKNSFVDDIVDQIESTPVKKPVDKAPSWSEGFVNGGGENAEGNLNGAFVSGSWYNDAGTGNPFVAAFVSPWVGINWTYENVASEISLFGVSVADLIATVLVLLVAAVSVTLLLKAVGVVT